MTTFLAGQEFDCVSPGPIATSLTANQRPPGSRYGVLLGTQDLIAFGTVLGKLTDPATGQQASTTKLWLHYWMLWNDTNGQPGNTHASFYRADGTEIVRIIASRNGSVPRLKMGYLSNGDFVYPQDYTIVGNNGVDYDILVDLAKGKLEMYCNQVAVQTFSGLDLSGLGSISSFRLTSPSYGVTVGNFLAADYSTLGCVVRARRANAAGAHSDWTGSYTAVADTDDTTLLSTTTAGQTSTFKADQLDEPPAGSVLKAVVVTARAHKVDVDGVPKSLQFVIRDAAGNEKTSAAPVLLGDGLEPRMGIFEASQFPDISNSALNGYEYGFTSKA